MNSLQRLSEYGESYWLDNLTRDMLDSGALARRVSEQGLRGVTANPFIFKKAIAGSDAFHHMNLLGVWWDTSTFEKAITGSEAYGEQISRAVRAGRSIAEIYEELVTSDVRRACDVLRAVYDQNGGEDGYVSLEVSPHLAYDSAGSIEEARRLARGVDRPNLMIKIPATVEGLAAIEQLLFDGINVNVTLLFSVERYDAVADAYVRALERRAAAGLPLDHIASVASFFLSRIDTLVDRLLTHRIGADGGSACQPHPHTLLGKAAVASAKLAYRRWQRLTASPRWRALAAFGARPQRLLWASTGTKNPAYSDVMYVEPLIGPDTVITMPERTIEAFADHGHAANTLAKGAAEAARTLRALRQIGIDLKQVAAQLEEEGIEKFIRPYDALLHAFERKRAAYNSVDVQQSNATREQYVDVHELEPLAQVARQLRRDVVRMTTKAGSGHPSSCLSAAEIVAALFFQVMRWDPNDPHARDVDTFVLSKGHAAPILWAVLARAGAIDEDIMHLRRLDSTLEGHPTTSNPWVRVATGSLGQGLAAANGIVLANRLDGIDARVYCLLGDGECSEGSVWEAAQFASLNKLSNLIAIVDVNGFGQSGPAPYRHDTGVLAERFRAFGWHTIEIDGHDLMQVCDALQQSTHAGPTVIVARTIKGKGVSFIEGKDGWHGKVLTREQTQQALAELGEATVTLTVAPRRLGGGSGSSAAAPQQAPADYRLGEQVATRDAYGHALTKLGEHMPQVVAIDGDVMDSTRTHEFAQRFPDRFFEAYIAEQNMVGTALGLAVSGKIPYVTTFACFMSRAADFIRMAAHSRPAHLVFCGSHAGVSVGEDGPSQMGLEDLAIFRALNDSTVLYPSDAVSAERLTEEAAVTDGIVYLRTTRPPTPVIYERNETFPVGGSKTLRSSHEDCCTIVAAGITVHEALAAHDDLERRGIHTRVIDAYSIKPLDKATLNRAAIETGHLVVVEDHWIDGGLGDAVAAAVGPHADVRRLAVRNEPHSGKPDELFDRYGISRGAIEQAVVDLVEPRVAQTV